MQRLQGSPKTSKRFVHMRFVCTCYVHMYIHALSSISGLAKKVAGHQGLQLQKVVGALMKSSRPKKTLITNNK